MTDTDKVRLTEARRTFEQVNETVRQQANHTIELIKINLLLLGGVPLAGLFSQSGINIRYMAVVVLIILSIMIQIREYTSIEIGHGVNTDFISDNPPSTNYYEGIIQAYSEEASYMTDNSRNVARNLFTSILLTVAAVAVLLLLLIL